MFAKLAFLLCATSVLSFKLGTTPEQLQALIAQIDEDLKYQEHEAQIEIRATLAPLAYYTNNAKTYLIGNVTEDAKPYWKEIASLEEQAVANGQDISTCIETGNNQLYALNNSILLAPWQKIESVYTEGHNIVLHSSSAAYSVIEDLLDLNTRAKECSDNTCADELSLEADTMYKKSLDLLVEVVKAPQEYSITNLPDTLADININKDAYVQSYSSILEDIKSCVSEQ